MSGCAGQVNMLPTLSPETILQPGQGMVVAKVVNASGYPLPFNQLTLTPKNLNESKEIKPERLSALTDTDTSSTVFASPLKTGKYALSSIRAFHTNGDFWYSRFASTDAKFGTFEVLPGQVTDLGTIIYYPKSDGDRYVNMLLRRPPQEPAETLHDYFPYYEFDLDSVRGWDQDDFEMKRNTSYVSAARNPVTYNEKYVAPDGSLYFIGKLGIIIKRAPGGDWEMDAVDTNLDLHTIAANSRGDLVIAGEEGKVFTKRAGGDWIDASLNHSVRIHQANFINDDQLDLLTSEGSRLNVLRAAVAADNKNWQTVASYRPGLGWYDGRNSLIYSTTSGTSKTAAGSSNSRQIRSVSMKHIQGRSEIFVRTLATYANPTFSSGKLETFVVDPTSWTISGEGNVQQYSAVVDAGATKLAIKEAGFWSWDGKPDFLRLDLGSNEWEEISTQMRSCPEGYKLTGNSCKSQDGRDFKINRESFSFTGTPWFKTDEDAIAIALFREKSASTGKYEQVAKVIKTTNGGKSWSKTGFDLPTDYCGTLIPDLKDHMLLTCKGGSSDFYESFDEGASWQHVREHENF